MNNGTDRRPEMTLSAKRAGEEADRLIAELAEQNKAAAGKTAAEPATPASTQPAAEPVTPQDTQNVGHQSDVVVQQDKTSEEALALLRKEIDTANARWQSLQGMVNKKDSEIEQMRLLLAQMSQKAEQPAAPVSLVTAKDEEDFGADMVDMNRRVASEVFNSMINLVNARLDKMEQSIAGINSTTTKIVEESFDESLTRQVPDWEAVDKNPEFIAWLSEEDGFSGRTKLELLQAAYGSGNLRSTVAIFNAFKASKAPVVSPTSAPPAEPPLATNVTKFVAPGKSKSSSAPQVPVAQEKIWTSGAISKLYSDKRNKLITEEEFVKQESDLFAAQREGRIAA